MNRPKATFQGLRASETQLALLILSCALLVGCAKRETELVEQKPVYQPPSPTTATTQMKIPNVVAPKLNEVEEAVKRVFKTAAIVHPSHTPNFIVGDFNGDESQDLVVVLKPVEIRTLNEEYPAWLLRDPFGQTSATSEQLRVSEDETLLAIIHGYGANDWRDQQATQTYLLKNAAGTNLSKKDGVEFVKANSGRRLPRVRGDVIAESLRGSEGCLYYINATYQWYDPKTFRGDTELSAFHGRKTQASR